MRIFEKIIDGEKIVVESSGEDHWGDENPHTSISFYSYDSFKEFWVEYATYKLDSAVRGGEIDVKKLQEILRDYIKNKGFERIKKAINGLEYLDKKLTLEKLLSMSFFDLEKAKVLKPMYVIIAQKTEYSSQYALNRLLDGNIEVMIYKSIRDPNQFDKEITLLSKIFSAQIHY